MRTCASVTFNHDLQSPSNARAWIDELTQYLDNGNSATDKPARVLWYSPAHVLSSLRADAAHTSWHNIAMLDAHARAMLSMIGASVIDVAAVSQSMWEATYDGVHYLRRGSDGVWRGCVSGMMFQVALNAMFPDCDGTSS